MCENLRIYSCVKIVLKLFLSDNFIKVEEQKKRRWRNRKKNEISVQLFLLLQKKTCKKTSAWKSPKMCASTNVYVQWEFPSIYLCFSTPLSDTFPPQCHWILKIWRHLDWSRRIIFRFQLIYHCRGSEKGKKEIFTYRDFCLKQGKTWGRGWKKKPTNYDWHVEPFDISEVS